MMQGTRLRKKAGAYADSVWLFVASFEWRGQVRYVCALESMPGLLHIFDPAQLEGLDKTNVVN